jgi:hypothetical protein
MFIIKIPLLRLVIGDFVKFAEAREPEMSILFVFVLNKGTALRIHHATSNMLTYAQRSATIAVRSSQPFDKRKERNNFINRCSRASQLPEP